MRAQTFDSLHTVVGSRALDDILPAMLEQLGDPEMHENALDGLRQIMAIKSRAVLPYLIPQLTASPVNTKALSILASVAGESLNKHLAKILPAMLEQLGDPEMHENALDGLRQIMAIKSRAVLPYLIPQLTASPVNTKALSILASVAGESLNKHLAKILPALLSSLAESHGTPDETVELGYARAVVLSVQDETGKF